MARPGQGSTGAQRPNGFTDTAGLQGPAGPSSDLPPAVPPAVPSRQAKPAGDKRNLLSILLKDDGTPDFDRMRPDTRGKFETAARALGITPAVSSTPAGGSSAMLPAEVGLALAQALATIDQAIVARITKAPRELIQLAAWTPDEKSAIAPMALAVANKYGGSVLSKYGEECALALTLVSLTQVKIVAIRQAMDTYQPPAPNVPPAPDPIQ